MGADGRITLLNADACDEQGYEPFDDFTNVYERTLGCVRVYTVYADTEYFGAAEVLKGGVHTLIDYHDKGLVLDEWEVWT